MATTTGIFDCFEQSTDLLNTWMQHKQEEEQKRLQPLADLLLDTIVWPSILAKKADIFASLHAKCRTAKQASELQVPVWSFFHVADYPRPGKNVSRAFEIDENGWRQQVAIYGADSLGAISWAPVWNVVNATDFYHQLAERFGGNFTISTTTTDGVEETDSTGAVYYRHTVHLMLNYFPYGLPYYHKERRQKFEEAASPLRRSLMPGEKFALWRSTAEGHHFVYGPPRDPWVLKPKSSKVGASCYCGSAHDDDDDESYSGY
jgi:hypothetical protein